VHFVSRFSTYKLQLLAAQEQTKTSYCLLNKLA